jgi:two-component system, response regulator
MSDLAFLAVEDDPNDTLFLQRAFRKLGFGEVLRVLPDGKEAQDYLSGRGKYNDPNSCPVPDVLILDLKLPRLNGFEFLAWLRVDTRLASTPVVVLTSSSDPGDIERAKSLGVLSYFVKPGGAERLLDCVKEIVSIRQDLRARKCVTLRFPSLDR